MNESNGPDQDFGEIDELLELDDEPDIIEIAKNIADHGRRPKTLSDNPLLDDALILRLTYDLATRVHPPEQIAVRYGLGDVDGLKDYLRAHPSIVSEAAQLRKENELRGVGGDGEEDRVRRKFLHATEELIMPVAGIVADPRTPISARIDGFKQLQRGAGLDGLPARALQQTREQGQPFNLTINFAGGREPLNIVADVLNDTQIPALSSQPPLPVVDSNDEDESFEDMGDEV